MCEHNELFQSVRQALYESFPSRADALFNLLAYLLTTYRKLSKF